MRFSLLQIPAFGPFSNLKLEFPFGTHDLHLFYGDNESGKSSLLRAIRNLLFGIPAQSTDDFIHDYKKFLLAAEIENRAGQKLFFSRRKGNKNSLLDQAGNPLDDAALKPFLGNVDESFFNTMFGLGNDDLRAGASQLLAGEGEIGQALFSASLGRTPIQRVLESLNEESAKLFKGKSNKVSIRQAVALHKELMEQSRDHTISADAWQQLEKNLQEQSEEKKNVELELEQVTNQLAWFDRCEDAFPSISRLQEEELAISALPQLPEVASDFVARVRAAQKAVSESSGKVATLQEQIADLQKRLAACPIAPQILAQAESIDRLHELLGNYREQIKSVNKLNTERTRLEHTLRTGMSSLGVGGDIDSLEKLRLTSAVYLNCEASAGALRDTLTELSQIGSKSGEFKADIESDEDDLRSLPETDLEPLRQALAVAAEATDADLTIEATKSALDLLIIRVTDDRIAVQGVPEDLDAVDKLTVPAPATIRKFRDQLAGLNRQVADAKKRIADESEKLKSDEKELLRLERRGVLPSEESLQAARAERDLGWNLVLADWKGDGAKEQFHPTLPLEEAFPQAISKADEIADQLRRDAESVAQAEEKRLQIRLCQAKISDIKAELVALQSEIEVCQTLWQAEWASVGVTARSPDEMEEWRNNWVRLRDGISQLREKRAALAEKQRRIQEAKIQLAAAMNDSVDKKFAILFDAAKRLVQKGEESVGQKREIEKRLKQVRNKLANLERTSSDLASRLKQATVAWQDSCRAAGLPVDTSPDSGLKLLQERKELLASFDRWKTLSAEVNSTAREIANYEKLVREKAALLGPDNLPTEQQAAALWKAFTKARDAQTEYNQYDSQITEAQKTLKLDEQVQSDALEAYRNLLRLAKVTAAEDLEPLIANLERQKQIQDRISSARDTLTGLARGHGLPEFIAQVRAEKTNDLPERKASLHAAVKEKKSKMESLVSSLERLKTEKERLEKAGDAAAHYRQQAESVSTKLQEDAARFIRLRLAAHLLETQIERFRQVNQGPLLDASGRIFSQLTRDSFKGLGTSFNKADKQVMVGRRANGCDVHVEGMSDGTRDQLFLSLRLAAIDRHLQTHEPMPLILDDLLITFDDERTKAILPQLAERAQRSQIFVFTHHKHLVQLFEEVLGETNFKLHQLTANPSDSKIEARSAS